MKYYFKYWITFKKNYDGVHFICIPLELTKKVLKAIYEGMFEGYYAPTIIDFKIRQVNYYWPTFLKIYMN